MDDATRSQLFEALGYVFKDPTLLDLALTHASTSMEGRPDSNERLEFLGDSVLGVVVCDMLYRRFPDLREGEMTKIKSHAVSRETCARIAMDLGLDRVLILGKGMQNSGPLPASLSAAALEAVIGAMFLDGGYDVAAGLIRPRFSPLVERAARSGHQQNFKSVLQQHAQQVLGASPVYRTLDEQGPDHSKCFKVCVEIGGRRFEGCWAQTKKRAEQEAALAALREMGLVREGADGDVDLVIPEPTGAK